MTQRSLNARLLSMFMGICLIICVFILTVTCVHMCLCIYLHACMYLSNYLPEFASKMLDLILKLVQVLRFKRLVASVDRRKNKFNPRVF